jgi:hypothetical protein
MLLEGKRPTWPNQSVAGMSGMEQYLGSEYHLSAKALLSRFCVEHVGEGDDSSQVRGVWGCGRGEGSKGA